MYTYIYIYIYAYIYIYIHISMHIHIHTLSTTRHHYSSTRAFGDDANDPARGACQVVAWHSFSFNKLIAVIIINIIIIIIIKCIHMCVQ